MATFALASLELSQRRLDQRAERRSDGNAREVQLPERRSAWSDLLYLRWRVVDLIVARCVSEGCVAKNADNSIPH